MKNLKSQILDTQEVSVALELVLSTLDSEVKRIYNIGANAMKAQDNSTALEVINFSEKLKPFISKVESLIKDWNNIIEEKEKASEKVQEILDKSNTIYGDKTRKTSTGFKRDVKNNIAPQTNLTVKFADGTVITNHNAYETFVQAIEYIGEDKVYQLGIKHSNEELVSKIQSKKYPSSSHESKSGYFVLTHSSTEDKIKHLNNIAKRLNVDLEISTQKK